MLIGECDAVVAPVVIVVAALIKAHVVPAWAERSPANLAETIQTVVSFASVEIEIDSSQSVQINAVEVVVVVVVIHAS